MVLCIFCNKEYKNKYILKTHQKRPSCLKNKTDVEEPIVYNCDVCNKVFARKFCLVRHKTTCKVNKIKILTDAEKENILLKAENKALKDANTDFKAENKALKDVNTDLKNQIKELQKRPTTVINNNKTINVMINNYVKESPKCVSYDVLTKYIPNLSISHLLSGGNGLALYVIKNILTDVRMVTTDNARSVVVYLKKEGTIYTDTFMNEFIALLAKSIKVPANDLITAFINQLNLDLTDEDDFAQCRKYTNIISDIRLATEGNEPTFAPAFRKRIHSATLAKNLIK